MNIFNFKEKKLISAIKNKDILTIQSLIEDSEIDINYQNKHKTSPLIEAVRVGDIEIVRLVLKKSPNLEFKDFFDFTALMISATEGNYEVSQLLINSGADVNAQDRFGESILMYALEESFYDIANLLIDNKAHINIKDTSDGYTPLMIDMLSSDEFKLAPRLIAMGANVNEKDNDGTALIQLLAQEGEINKIEYLLNHGANIKDIKLEEIEEEKFKQEVRNLINKNSFNVSSSPFSNSSSNLFNF